MKYYVFISIYLLIAIQPAQAASEYIGDEACAPCHAEQYNQYRTSGHPYKLTRAVDARKRPIPLPKDYVWNDISYVIVGFHRKIRYIDKQGYIITAAKDGTNLKTQYNLRTGAWTYYHKGERKPYSCGKCHTTGFRKAGHQDGLPGIKGTWSFPGIQCEACHSLGSAHAKSGDKGKIKIDRSARMCGNCHVRGDVKKSPPRKATSAIMSNTMKCWSPATRPCNV